MMLSFEAAIDKTSGKQRSLLIGNGFSSKYFDYRSLLDHTDLTATEPLRELFGAHDTYDFEIVIRSLEESAKVEDVYGNSAQADHFRMEAQRLREQLVHAIRTTHPTHREDLEKYFVKSREFLDKFGMYFTLNYDLLLYWIQLDTKSYTDGFGKAKEEAGFRKSYDPTAYCNTFNLHGGLHLFLGYVGDLHKRVKGASGIIDAIADTITREKRLPLYVAEGTSRAKLAKINSVPYLRHCYEKLMACTGNVFVFGHSASANDAHIYSALFGSKIEVLYFGVYKPTDESVRLIESQLSMFQKLHKRKVDYVLYDAGSANVWGDL